MATELGSAFISVGLGTNNLAGEIKKAFGSAESSGSDAGKAAGRGFGGAFGIAAAALGSIGIGAFFKSAVSGAADLEQSVGAVDAVFKGSAEQMHAWASTAATDVGLTSNEFNELGTLIGSQLKNGGTAMEELAPKTKDLITLGADLSSMFGGTTKDAVAALSSALKGERDPIEAYGVSLNQAKIDAEAAALGFAKVDGAFDQQAQQAATLSLIMKQTADAHGNFGRETDTLAHKQQVLNAQWANGKARIGAELLPAVAAFTGVLSNALGPAINGTVAGIRTVIGGAQGLYDLLVKGDFTGAFAEAFNVSEDSPVVGALFTVRSLANDAGGAFRAMFAAFKAGDGDVTSSGFAGFMEQLGGTARQVFEVIKPLGAVLGETFAQIGPQIMGVLPLLSPFGLIFQSLLPVLPQIAVLFGNLAVALGDSLAAVLPTVSGLVSTLVGTLSGVFVAIMPAVVQLVEMLASGIATLAPVIAGVVGALAPLIASLVSQLAPIITDLVSSIMPPIITIFGDVIGAIAPLITLIAGLLIPIIEALLPVVVTVFAVIADVIKNVMQIVMGVIQVVTGIISGDWDKVWTGIQNIFSGIWNTIISILTGVLRIIGQVVISGIGLVGSFIGDTLNNIGRFFSDTWNNIVSGVSGFIGNVLGFFRDLPGKIMGVLSGAGSWLLDVGKNIVQGLIDGIGSMMGAIGRAILSIVPEAIRGPFEQALGIHSPSRVFRDYGINIGQGLIQGVDGMHGRIESAVTGMVSVPSVPSFGAGSFTPASFGVGAGAGNTYNTTINQVDDPIGTSHAVTRRLVALGT